ncbi:hypothetical protein M3J09_009003 [Ascochyta lentis]
MLGKNCPAATPRRVWGNTVLTSQQPSAVIIHQRTRACAKAGFHSEFAAAPWNSYMHVDGLALTALAATAFCQVHHLTTNEASAINAIQQFSLQALDGISQRFG